MSTDEINDLKAQLEKLRRQTAAAEERAFHAENDVERLRGLLSQGSGLETYYSRECTRAQRQLEETRGDLTDAMVRLHTAETRSSSWWEAAKELQRRINLARSAATDVEIARFFAVERPAAEPSPEPRKPKLSERIRNFFT